jgi:glycosyltransferase involved in cell wall biosynthesis
LRDKNLKLHIDSFEPHAEAMVENKTWNKSGLKYKVLFYFEKIEARVADYLIFAAPGMEKYIREKYKTSVVNYSVKPACIDLEAFSGKFVKNSELVNKYNLEGKIVCVYAGKFGGIYLEDETFQFIKSCEKHWGADKFRFLLLSNTCEDYLKDKQTKFGIEPSTIIKLFVTHREVPEYMGLADFAISPVKPVPTKKYCTPIKDGEYWAMGLPVVITPNISIDSDIIKENRAGAILESFDANGYNNAITQINSIIKGKSRVEVYNQIRPLAEKYRNFSIAGEIYKKIYGEL